MDNVGIAASIAGHGDALQVSKTVFGASGIFALFARQTDVSGAVFYLKITALNGSASLTYVPGLKLDFRAAVPKGTLRLAELDNGVWTTVGKPGTVKGKTVTFAAVRVPPPIHLKDGDSLIRRVLRRSFASVAKSVAVFETNALSVAVALADGQTDAFAISISIADAVSSAVDVAFPDVVAVEQTLDVTVPIADADRYAGIPRFVRRRH